jgi:hypothetical protein
MAHSDPRLADLTLLVLAAKRAHAARQAPDWRQTEGLSALLAAARSLPQRDPWALPDFDETSGLGRLLAEARAWQPSQNHDGHCP